MKSLVLLGAISALAACASVKPDIKRPETPGGMSAIKVENTLTFSESCSQARGDYKGNLLKPSDGSQIAFLAGPLASALVTTGVDFIGNKLKSAAEEKTRTFTAVLNQNDVPPRAGCLVFTRKGKDGSTDSNFLILLQPTDIPIAIEPQLVAFDYAKSIDGKAKGVRGLTLTISASKPGSKEASTQTISLGNVQVGAKHTWNSTVKTPFFAPYMANPYLSKVAKPAKGKPKYKRSVPLTWSVTLTEVRNANELAGFANDTFSNANDGITEALIGALGLGNDAGDSGGDQDVATPTGPDGQTVDSN